MEKIKERLKQRENVWILTLETLLDINTRNTNTKGLNQKPN